MKIFLIIITLVILLAIIFFLIKLFKNYLYNLIDKRIERFQSDLIEKQIRETENMYKSVRSWRHDYRNHIQNMKILLNDGNYKELGEYLNELTDDLNTVDTVIKTGNVMVDAILNSKLTVAKKANINLNVKANIPKSLPMSDVEICTLMGNLLDNAIEACEKLPEAERFIRIYIGTYKNQFYLSVQNSAGEVKKFQSKYMSTKKNSKDHGYGIFRIDRIVNKYKGYLSGQNEEGVFATEISVPINK